LEKKLPESERKSSSDAIHPGQRKRGDLKEIEGSSRPWVRKRVSFCLVEIPKEGMKRVEGFAGTSPIDKCGNKGSNLGVD